MSLMSCPLGKISGRTSPPGKILLLLGLGSADRPNVAEPVTPHPLPSFPVEKAARAQQLHSPSIKHQQDTSTDEGKGGAVEPAAELP